MFLKKISAREAKLLFDADTKNFAVLQRRAKKCTKINNCTGIVLVIFLFLAVVLGILKTEAAAGEPGWREHEINLTWISLYFDFFSPKLKAIESEYVISNIIIQRRVCSAIINTWIIYFSATFCVPKSVFLILNAHFIYFKSLPADRLPNVFSYHFPQRYLKGFPPYALCAV